MDTLIALFGTPSKVKLLRLFIFNKGVVFLLPEVVARTKCPSKVLKKEISLLTRVDILKKKFVVKDIQSLRRGKTVIRKIKGLGYTLNDKFSYLESLKTLLTVASIRADESLARRFLSAGRIKLFLAAGIFNQQWDSRVDILIVGDDLNLQKIENTIRIIESELGKEISYCAFETQDFEYRLGIHDRLIRDILDYQHITLVDRIGIDTKQ